MALIPLEQLFVVYPGYVVDSETLKVYSTRVKINRRCKTGKRLINPMPSAVSLDRCYSLKGVNDKNVLLLLRQLTTAVSEFVEDEKAFTSYQRANRHLYTLYPGFVNTR